MIDAKNILVPTDFSDHSDRTLAKALEVAKSSGAKVHLLHVIDDKIQQCVIDYCLENEAMEQLKTEGVKASREALRRQIQKVPAAREAEIALEVRTGSPYEEIARFQKENGIDLIVIAPYGRTSILRHLIGGVAEKVIRGVSCPVLLLRD